MNIPEPNPEKQSLARPLTPAEDALASALEQIFATGCHDFSEVAKQLQIRDLARPSGSEEAWDEAALGEEIRLINASLEEAYQDFGVYLLRRPNPSERELSEKYRLYLEGLAKA